MYFTWTLERVLLYVLMYMYVLYYQVLVVTVHPYNLLKHFLCSIKQRLERVLVPYCLYCLYFGCYFITLTGTWYLVLLTVL